VKFYAEYVPIIFHSSPSINWNYWNTYGSGTVKGMSNPCFTTLDCFNGNPPIAVAAYLANSATYVTSASCDNATYTSSTNVNYNETPKQEMKMCSPKFKSPGVFTREIDNSIETGRIEKGSSSNQSFQYDDTTFESYYSWASDWKILPKSQSL